MFKGVFNEDGGGHRMYRHFLPMLSLKVCTEVVLAFLTFYNNS